jgi:hypothetical protein
MQLLDGDHRVAHEPWFTGMPARLASACGVSPETPITVVQAGTKESNGYPGTLHAW